jgi:hypothetical protein
MQNPVIERIGDETAQISEANRLHLAGGKGKPHGGAGNHERRLRRLQEIFGQVGGAHRLEKVMNQAARHRQVEVVG